MFPRWHDFDPEHQYKALDGDEKHGDQSTIASDMDLRTSFWTALPWAICIILAMSIAAIWVQTPYCAREEALGTFEAGFKTDLKPITEALRVKKVRFYGGFHFDADGNCTISHNPAEPRYVGAPSDAVDMAWDKLMDERFIGLTPEEGKDMGLTLSDEDYYSGRYWAEPSGFHNLHCLNYLRQSLRPEYYTSLRNSEPKPWVPTHQLHIDHCIELIRQSLMCSIDLTSIPKQIVGNSETGIMWHSDQDQVHTCRDFGATRLWLDEWRSSWAG